MIPRKRGAGPRKRRRAAAEDGAGEAGARRDRRGAPVDASLGPVLDFMRTLWALDHRLTRASKDMRRRIGVTGPQRMVIRIVGRYPGIAAGEVAAVLHVHPSTLTGVLKRLVGRGLLARRKDRRDARRAVLSLTEKGRALARSREGTVEARVRGALATLERRDIATAQSVLRTVARRMQVG